MATCKHCGEEKDESLMALRAGKPSKVCIDCKQNRAGLGAGAPKKKQKRPPRAAKVSPALEIEVPGGGHGFKASLTEDGALLITQENADAAADNIVLERHEARSLFQIFGEWANGG